MRSESKKAAVVFTLIFTLIYSQVIPVYAGPKKRTVRVAFAGMKFEEFAPDIQEKILHRVNQVFVEDPSLQFVSPAEVRKTMGPEAVAELLDQQDQASFLAVAEKLDVEFVFAGALVNNSRDPNRILVDGEIVRFHRHTLGILRYEILTYYEDLGVELMKFKQGYVDTMSLSRSGKSGSQLWPLLIVGGVVAAGIIAWKVAGGSTAGDEEGPDVAIE